jgi:nucleoside-diphosphate-sugar epimerase
MVLVTGGTGMLGAHVLFECVKKKPAAAIYRRLESIKKVENLFKKLAPDNPEYFESIIWKQAELNDINALNEAFKGIDFVYHCAAKVSLAEFHIKKLIKTNIEGTANVVNIAIKHKVKKLAYVSSIAAIGAETQINLVNEDHSWSNSNNHSAYAHSKYGAELEVWRASQEGLPVVIINPGVILGSFFWERSSGMIIKRVAKGLTFYPTGNVSVVGIEDVVTVLINLMESDIKNERFILVSDNLSQKELVQKIANKLNRKPPKIPLKKWMLILLYITEKVFNLIFLKKNFLSIPLIESLCSLQYYDGSKINSYMNFSYCDFDKTLKKISANYDY